jgi:uncharacterized protein (TIGR00369 family)
MADPAKGPIPLRIQASFDRQAFMTTIGARLISVEPGEVVIEWPYNIGLTQQHGFLHAGVVAAVADSACGYAALTMMGDDAGVLSVEFKVNLMKPAAGETFVATGRVIRAGRTLTVCSAEVQAFAAGKATTIAIMQGTMMSVRDSAGVTD